MNVMWVPMFEVPDIQVVAFAEGLKAAGLSSAAYFMCPLLHRLRCCEINSPGLTLEGD